MRKTGLALTACLFLVFFTTQIMAASLILNEFNAISNSDMLKDGGVDSYFGQTMGNGGD